MVARTLALAAACAFLLAAKHDKIRTAHAENDAVAITATPLTDSESIRQELSTDLGNHYILMKVEVVPKGGKPLAVHVDDFLLRTEKDGEKTTPFVPSQMTGEAALVVSQVLINGNGAQNQQSGPNWGGMIGRGGMGPGNGGQMGNGAATAGNAAKLNQGSGKKDKDDPLRAELQQKMLPEKETSEPLSGLVYFPMEKQKVKDLELIYTTPSGKLDLRFR